MHLKRRARPLLHGLGSIFLLRPRWERIRAQRLGNQRIRDVVRDHAHQDVSDILQIDRAGMRPCPEAPCVVGARGEVRQGLFLNLSQRDAPILVRGFAGAEAVEKV